MKFRKNCLAINTTAILIEKAQESWKRQEIAGVLLIDIRRAFDYVLQIQLAQRIANLDFDDNFIRWTKSFLTN